MPATEADSAALVLLHADPALLAVAKPPGIAVIPGRGETPAQSLRGRLEAQLGIPLWVVHRIDRDTSGLVLFARDAAAHRGLNLAFEQRQVQKTYLALAAGSLPERGSCTLPLHAARKGKMRPARPGEPGALPAHSDFRVLQRFRVGAQPLCLVEVQPHSGRQHQIRVHLRSLGAPLLGDPLYALPLLAPLPATRLALHAARLELAHPHDGRPLCLEAPLAPDLATLLQWLQPFAVGTP